MDGGAPPSKIDLLHSESNVIFLICDCTLTRNYSFYSLNRDQAARLINRLKHIEKMTWAQLSALDRTRGLSPEIPGTDSYNMIHEQNTSERKLVEQYYFHFRVEQTGLFRVFGYQRDQYFCITHLDPDGRIHH